MSESIRGFARVDINTVSLDMEADMVEYELDKALKALNRSAESQKTEVNVIGYTDIEKLGTGQIYLSFPTFAGELSANISFPKVKGNEEIWEALASILEDVIGIFKKNKRGVIGAFTGRVYVLSSNGLKERKQFNNFSTKQQRS